MDAITYGSLFLILGSTRLSVLTCCISENPGSTDSFPQMQRRRRN